MRPLPIAVVALCVCSLFSACDDNPADEDQTQSDPTKANQIATEGFQALGDTIQAIEDRDADGLRDMRFDAIRDKLDQALDYEANNGIAHLGLSIVEILELNYSSDIWELVDSLDAWGGQIDEIPLPFKLAPASGHSVLLGRQFELMTMLPVMTTMGMATTVPSNVSLARVQDIITNTVQPALNRSIGHLNKVESQTRTELHMHIKDNGVDENITVDRGEILVFSAAVRALRAGFGFVTAYDMDLFGRDGTYSWIDDLRNHGGTNYCNYAWWVDETSVDSIGVNLSFNRDQGLDDAVVDSIYVDVARYNLEDRDGFLALRNGGAVLANAHADLLSVLSHLEDAAAFIRARPNETEENVIKLADLTDLDDGVGDPDGPNFAQDWTRIEDVIAFVRDVLTGPVQFTEELGPNNTSFSWTTDLSRLFTAPVTDWHSLLPYHDWNLPVGNWFESYDSVEVYYASGYDVEQYTRFSESSCGFSYWPHVHQMTYTTRHWVFDRDATLQWLDGPGGSPVDLGVARFPYCPDYTFHGMFPDMTRARWLQLIDIMDPPYSTTLAGRQRVGPAR